jgi:polyisoprenoid-binding protein YceI
MREIGTIVLGCVAALTLAASPPPSPSPANPNIHAFDLQHSKMTVYVYKQGIFAFAADNHEVDAPIASGSFDSAKNAVELTVDATKMKVLDPSMDPGRRETVQSNMSGPMVLDAGKYPTITFRSTKTETGESGHWKVTGDLTLHGQTHSIALDVTKIDATHFNGSVMVRQSAFGITPIRIAGGTVKVKDDLKVVFEIALNQA